MQDMCTHALPSRRTAATQKGMHTKSSPISNSMCIMQTLQWLALLTKHKYYWTASSSFTMSLTFTVLVHHAMQLTLTAIEWEGTERGVVIECHITAPSIVQSNIENGCLFLFPQIELLHPLDFEQFAIFEHILLQHFLIIQEDTIFGAQPESVVPTFHLPWPWICDLLPF